MRSRNACAAAAQLSNAKSKHVPLIGVGKRGDPEEPLRFEHA